MVVCWVGCVELVWEVLFMIVGFCVWEGVGVLGVRVDCGWLLGVGVCFLDVG